MKLYETLADEIEASIRQGLLRPGEKLPSMRYTSSSRAVSASTVFQAYYLLESRGLVRGRERSGYFVTSAAGLATPEPPQASTPTEHPISVDVSDMIFKLLEDSRAPDAVGLASAFPSAFLYPLPRLAKAIVRTANWMGPKRVLEDLSPGNGRLRRQISLRYGADGMQISDQEILVTNGALEALNLCLSAVTQPGDSVIIESPTFYGALQALEARGLRAVQVATDPCTGVDLHALERAIRQHAPSACWLMTNFQNPLGSLMSPADKQALVALLARYELPLIEDDVYADLFFGANRPPPAKSFDNAGLVMHCSSFAKSLAPGFRIGWVAPGRFMSRVTRNKLALNLNTSIPPQLAIASYMEHGAFDKHLRKLRLTLSSQQAVLADAVARHFPAGTRATRPQGGYLLWVELPPEFDALQLYQDAKPLGICVAPGTLFSPEGRFRNCLRLNYGHPFGKRGEAAMASLGQLLQQQRAAA
ncbi:aminotransferase-like domain-containing protein [Ramlibacter sp.]|uniref:aminotransferase-like domain-containing protein n=1 Tax=Ramlibacter sp. TaxID=1917967 RepID=UPI002FCB367B